MYWGLGKSSQEILGEWRCKPGKGMKTIKGVFFAVIWGYPARPLKGTLEDSENTSNLSWLMERSVIFTFQLLVCHWLRILRDINSPDFWMTPTIGWGCSHCQTKSPYTESCRCLYAVSDTQKGYQWGSDSLLKMCFLRLCTWDSTYYFGGDFQDHVRLCYNLCYTLMRLQWTRKN